MSIPQSWYDERSALYAQMHAQADRAELNRKATEFRKVAQAAGVAVAADAPVLEPTPDEQIVTDDTIAQLDATPVTAEDLAALAGARGYYLDGDTRGFVMEQERLCALQNCWMLRKPDGSPSYVSEAPVA